MTLDTFTALGSEVEPWGLEDLPSPIEVSPNNPANTKKKWLKQFLFNKNLPLSYKWNFIINIPIRLIQFDTGEPKYPKNVWLTLIK